MRNSTLEPSEGGAATSRGDLFSLFFSSVWMLCCINRPAIFSFSCTPSPETESAFCIYSKQTQQIVLKTTQQIELTTDSTYMYLLKTASTNSTDNTDSNTYTQNRLKIKSKQNRLNRQYLKQTQCMDSKQSQHTIHKQTHQIILNILKKKSAQNNLKKCTQNYFENKFWHAL